MDACVFELCRGILVYWISVEGYLFLSSVQGYLYLGSL